MKRIGDLLTRHKMPAVVQDDVTYKQVTIRTNYRGVVLRGTQRGTAILTKDQWRVSAGQFILSRIDARNGAFGIIPPELEGAIVTNDFLAFDINETEVEREFFNVFLQSPLFLEACIKASRGNTNRKRVDEAFFLNFPVDLPPLSEQHRLIAKINRARAAVATAEREIAHQEDLVAKLKQAILQEAITGRLTAGWRAAHPDVEPASQLLARIQAEKKRLIAAKKFRPEKPLPPIAADEVPFAIPDGWAWCRLGTVIAGTESGWSPACLKEPSSEGKWGVLKTTAVQICEYLPHENKGLPPSLNPRPEHEVAVGDILMTRAGPANRVGICALVRQTPPKLMISDKIVRFRGVLIKGEYLELFSNTPEFQKLIEASKQGMAQSQVNISQENLKATVLPLPPLSEQTEIVARMESLMERCRELEAEIARSRAHAEALLQAVLREAFAPAVAPAVASDIRLSIKPLAYLLQFLPALARAAGGTVTLEQLNRAVSCLFLSQEDMLPLVEKIGGAEARDHFARFGQTYEDGAFLAAVRTLLKANAFIEEPRADGMPVYSLTDNLPPITPEVDGDARHLAPILERIPEKVLARSAPRREAPRVQEALLPLA
jgi:type I restriction enzyme, S subunit